MDLREVQLLNFWSFVEVFSLFENYQAKAEMETSIERASSAFSPLDKRLIH